ESLNILGYFDLLADADGEAAGRFEGSLQLARKRQLSTFAWAVEGTATICARAGRFEPAARLLGAAVRRAVGLNWTVPTDELVRQTAERARAALGDDAFNAAYAAGAALSLEQAVSEAQLQLAELRGTAL